MSDYTSNGGPKGAEPLIDQKIPPDDLKKRLDAVDSAPVESAPSAVPYIALLPIDPYRLHAFWKISPSAYTAALEQLGDAGTPALCIRMLQLPGMDALDEEAAYWFDVEVHGFSQSWEIDVAEGGRCYRAVLGLRSPSGRWVAVARSRAVRTPAGRAPDLDMPMPPKQPAPVFAEPKPPLDEEAILADVDAEMKAASAADPTPGASLSSAWSAVTEHAVDTVAEWVIEGRAAPGLQVWVQHRPVPLDGEGRFAIRRPISRHELDAIRLEEGPDADWDFDPPAYWSASRWNEPLFEMAATLHLRGRIEGVAPPALAALGATVKEDGTFGLVKAVPRGAFLPPSVRITAHRTRDGE